MALTAKTFRSDILTPNLDELDQGYDLIHRAFNAVAAVDAYAAHIFYAAEKMDINVSAELSLDQKASRDDTAFRQALSDNCSEFCILRDLAKANKHARLTRHRPQVANSGQANVKSKGYGQDGYGEGRYGGPPQIFVEVNCGQ
ncbi:hypothetical protein C1J03_18930 [Sulfitobacter sp. SK012]|uniref:hypothetical protein n=1 Tax=Sulfitobacter sp. SK012 TaxID=1389005 RepID=UPI000E0BBA61|nr:hypothetical protein [Sulfitobacter sp. SK012]AXI47898.1 hypothetical protein C1J03_18930 [Sulfitobacter sp. SK012]